MSEEEIKILKVLINNKDIFYYEDDFNNRIRPLVGKLLNLYEDEKEKNRYSKAQIPREKIMNEEENNVLEYFKNKQVYDMELVFDYIPVLLNLIEKQQKELERYKRLAEMNLKDSEEFQNNMCEHRCILNNQIMELTEELNSLKEIEQRHREINGKLRAELEQEKEINKEIAFKNHKIKEESNAYREEIIRLDNELNREKEKNNELEIELSTRDNINVDKLVEKYKYYRRLADSYQANCISKDKIKELLENEIIDISGFRCIAVEDIENLLEMN